MKPTVFFVIDTETCRFDGMVFDIGWKAIDRKGREYSQGSYLCADVLQTDTPYYRKKIAAYWFKANTSITPVNFAHARNIFNQEISRLQNKGHRVVVCAYNAAFDQRVLDKTTQEMVGKRSQFVKSKRVDWLDIWLFWAMSCPQSAKEMPKLKSGRIRTTAEAVAQFEIASDYEHLHEGLADAEGEAEILRTVLGRKKKIPFNELGARCSRIANERLGLIDPNQVYEEKPVIETKAISEKLPANKVKTLRKAELVEYAIFLQNEIDNAEKKLVEVA